MQTSTHRMFQYVIFLRMIRSPNRTLSRTAGKVDGLLVAGRFKSLLLQHLSNFSPKVQAASRDMSAGWHLSKALGVDWSSMYIDNYV